MVQIRTNPAGRKAMSTFFKGIGIEVGVERGRFSLEILKTCDKLYVVDLWRPYEGYREHLTPEFYESLYEECVANLAKYDVGFIREDSVKAAELFMDNYVDFIYLDCSHLYEDTKKELNAYWKVLKSGGIYSGHDYKDTKNFGVIQAVNEFCEEKGIEELTIFAGDRTPSWMFIKP